MSAIFREISVLSLHTLIENPAQRPCFNILDEHQKNEATAKEQNVNNNHSSIVGISKFSCVFPTRYSCDKYQ